MTDESHPFKTLVPQWWPILVGVVSLLAAVGYQFATMSAHIADVQTDSAAQHQEDAERLTDMDERLRTDETQLNYLRGTVEGKK